MRIKSLIVATCCVLPAFGGPPDRKSPPTWVEIGGERYGAKPDGRGPIGGGAGYAKIVTEGNYRVSTLDQLLAALKKAHAGQTVYIPDQVEIDCTVRVVVEGLVIEIPGGVTLAGDRGHNGSTGALLYSDAFKTRPLLRAAGPEVRITGLRIRGPEPKRRLEHHRRSFAQGRGSGYYYKFPVSEGIRTTYPGLEVDNCELWGWSHAAIYLLSGDRHRIHHNFIHHNQYQGLGYGVCHDRSISLIERNLFDFNRHSIAGTGRPGSGYEARDNVELGTSLSHCFDMHGGADRKDGTNIAGHSIRIHHNTFGAPQRAVAIRGVPEEGALIHHNWFRRHKRPRQAVMGAEKTRVFNNAYGSDEPRVVDREIEGGPDRSASRPSG